jgi:all-trans-8'-apo-beta-carotenal 15,15'-oxygenase
MNRRDFVRLAGAAGFGTALAPTVLRAAESQDAWMSGFARAEASAPWALGFRSASGDIEPRPAQVRGRFPAAVRGVLFRNGPAVHDMAGQRYQHWFDGDGMVQRFAVDAASVVHSGRIVRTPKYRAEAAAGKRLRAGFGSQWPGMQPTTSPDSLNAANTSVLPLGGEVLALWEGGSAYRLNPKTLETLGPKLWRDDLSGVPFSAHPRVDPDGSIWNFGLSVLDDVMVLYQIGRDGQLRRAEALKLPQTNMVHDFAVTQRHLVFLMPPLVFEREQFHAGKSFVDSHVWRPEQGMRVLVVDKADWGRRQWLELPAGFLFHLGNAWEDAQGVIRVDYIHAAEPTALFQTDRAVMRGQNLPRPAYHIALARIDTAGRTASQELLRVDAEFPRIDPRLTGLRHTQLIHAAQTSAHHPGFSAVARSNVESGTTERYSYGEDHMAEEHLFVPEPGSAPGGSGWVLGTALDLKRRRTLLSCFRAGRLGDGPVAQATLSYALPLGLHGAFVKA